MRAAIAALVSAILLAFGAIPAAAAQAVPERALQYLPILVEKQRAIWPEAPMPSFLGAQVEKETCITLRHSKCWNPRAELKTSREWGIGFGQFTRAYRADGSIRFDKISELRRAHASLRDWTWDKRYDPGFQLTAIVEMNKGIYGRIRDAATPDDRLAFTLSAYNGGEGGLLQDRRLCANTSGCNQNAWFGHVEGTSLKSRTRVQGYGESFYAINRRYVREVLHERRHRYEPFFR